MVESQERRLGRRRAAGAAALFVVLAVGLTWPLAAKLGRSTPDEFRDARITTWVFAWNAHVLQGDPTDLFQAPIFHPEPDALVYTDHMFGLGVFAAPITWASGNAFVGHNVVFIAAIAFAAFAATLAAFELTGSFPAALVAGAAFGFAPYWANHAMHIQFMAAGWIPMTVYGLLRWWRTERVTALAVGAGSAVMASLTSWYQAAFVLVAILVVIVTFLVTNRPAGLSRMALHGAVAAAVAAAALIPFALPYRRVSARDPSYVRTLADVEKLSARPESYLAAPPTNWIYGDATSRWSAYPSSVELNLFPGIAVVVLAGIGIAVRKRNATERAAVLAFVLMVGVGVILSFGGAPSGPRRYLPWAFLSDHVVLFRGLRAAARAHVLVILGLALLAGFGVRAVLERSGRRAAIAAAILLGVVVAEGAAVPRQLGPVVAAPGVYETLAGRPGAVLELPLGRAYDADNMLRGIAHWKPMANGIAGYTPRSYLEIMQALESPPDAASVELLRSRGIRIVILHLERLGVGGAEMPDAFLARPGVEEWYRDSSLVILELAPP